VSAPEEHTVSFLFNTENQGLDSWLDRAERCADLIVASGVTGRLTLADVGCGDEKLRAVLERRGLAVDYQGFDIRPQSDGVIRFDAASEDLPLAYDVVVVLGLVEYLRSFSDFLQRLRPRCRRLALSHVASDLSHYTAADLGRLGWCNHLSRLEVEALIEDAGFRPLATNLTADRKTQIWMCA
jgi:hypothetical protein